MVDKTITAMTIAEGEIKLDAHIPQKDKIQRATMITAVLMCSSALDQLLIERKP